MLICLCYEITKDDILEGRTELAGTGCGDCLEEVEEIRRVGRLVHAFDCKLKETGSIPVHASLKE